MDGTEAIKYIVNNVGGRPVVGMQHEGGQQSVPLTPPPAPKAPKLCADPAAERNANYWAAKFAAATFIGVRTAGSAGCSASHNPAELFNDGGIPLVPPTDVPDGGSVTNDGVIVVVPGRDGTIRLPIDPNTGTPVLPGSVWLPMDPIDGSKVQETPWIEFTTPANFIASGLQNLQLGVIFGTDSSPILPNNLCVPDLPDIAQFTPGDLDAGVVGCPEPGFESYVACPQDEANRVKLYLNAYQVQTYRHVGGQDVDGGTQQQDGITTPDQVYTNPDGGVRMGNYCANTPNVVAVRKELYADGTISIKFKLRSIADATNFDAMGIYQTGLRVSLVILGQDGGASDANIIPLDAGSTD